MGLCHYYLRIHDHACIRSARDVTEKPVLTINTIRGAEASAIIYSITKTALANNLNVYYYIRHMLQSFQNWLMIKGILKTQWNRLCPGKNASS